MSHKHFTILHSNDIHGDILPEAGEQPGLDVGGLSLLSGYIKQARQQPNVLFTISGDMLQGSLIDSEYRGISTVEILNYLDPDVATLGNHEVDYGLGQLLLLEKLANFPIINANMTIKKVRRRLMRPCEVLSVAGCKILFIGIVTDMVLQFLKTDKLVEPLITLEDPLQAIAEVCAAYKSDDIDLTVLLTHIGFENDLKLAALLDPGLGVDLILGGHSHTRLDQPVRINDILIAQSGYGTNQLGRFEIVVDTESNRIVDWQWQLVPIDSNHCQPDKELEKFIKGYHDELDGQYNLVVGRLAKALHHERHAGETPLGNLLADILNNAAGNDLTLVSSAFIRGDSLGPLVTLGDLLRIFPYPETLYRVTVSGALLKRIFTHILRSENRKGDGDSFQVNRAVRAVFNDSCNDLLAFTIGGSVVQDDMTYRLGMHTYLVDHSVEMLGLSADELRQNSGSLVKLAAIRPVVEEYLRTHHNISVDIEGRIVLVE